MIIIHNNNIIIIMNNNNNYKHAYNMYNIYICLLMYVCI